jgi:hypothetical protein
VKRALIKDLHLIARQRRAGYLEACLKSGQASLDGQWMIFTDAAHAKLRSEYNPSPTQSNLVQPKRRKIGLGDALHKIAGPIGKAIHWPCMRGDGSTELKSDSPCAKARALANRVKI